MRLTLIRSPEIELRVARPDSQFRLFAGNLHVLLARNQRHSGHDLRNGTPLFGVHFGLLLLHRGDVVAVENVKSHVIREKGTRTDFEACIHIQIRKACGSFTFCDLLGQFRLLRVLLRFRLLCGRPVH